MSKEPTAICTLKEWERLSKLVLQPTATIAQGALVELACRIMEHNPDCQKLQKVIKKLKKFKSLPVTRICPHGDLNNMLVAWKAVVTQKLTTGKEVDATYEEIKEIWCEEHPDVELIDIEEIISYSKHVEEYKELTKVLRTLIGL